MSVRDDLKAYLDGELPPLRMAEIRDAINKDPALAREVEQLRALAASLQALASRPVMTGLEDTLAALGRAEKRRPWFIRYGFPLATATAAFVLAVAIAPKLRFNSSADAEESKVAYISKQATGAAAASSLATPAAPLAMDAPRAAAPSAKSGAEHVQTERFKRDALESDMKASVAGQLEGDRPMIPREMSKAPAMPPQTQTRTRATAPLKVAKERPKGERQGYVGPDLEASATPGGAPASGTMTIDAQASDQVVLEVGSPEEAEMAVRAITAQVNSVISAPGTQSLDANVRLNQSGAQQDIDMQSSANAQKPLEPQNQATKVAGRVSLPQRKMVFDVPAEDAPKVMQLASDTVKHLQTTLNAGGKASFGNAGPMGGGGRGADVSGGAGGFGGGGMGGGMMGGMGGVSDHSQNATPPTANTAPAPLKSRETSNAAKAPFRDQSSPFTATARASRSEKRKADRKRIVIVLRIRPKVNPDGTEPAPANSAPPAKSPQDGEGSGNL